MSKTRVILGGACALALMAGGQPRSAGAASDDGVSAIRGVGAFTCEQYTSLVESKESGAVDMIFGWIDGFVSALNATTPEVYEHLPWQRTDLVLDLLVNHCTHNPQDRLANAVFLFLDATRASRLAEVSDVATIEVRDGAPIEVYQEILRRVQQLLAEAGHYSSTVDGAYGPGTAAALRAFQAANNLPETGLPDQRTLLVLFAPTFERVN